MILPIDGDDFFQHLDQRVEIAGFFDVDIGSFDEGILDVFF